MPAQTCFSAGLLGADLGLEVIRHGLVDDDIRFDALGLDRAVRWRVVTRRRQPDRTVGAERNDRLHGALAERTRADDGRALLILQCTGDDFRRRSRTAVDQNDDLLAVRDVARPSVGTLGFFVVTTL